MSQLTKLSRSKSGMADRMGEIHSNAERIQTDDQNPHIHMTIKPCDRAGIVDGTEKHRSVNTFFTRNQLLPEGGGLSERTKATNSGFLRKPANSLSRKAPLMG
jgi:hypothetical protein